MIIVNRRTFLSGAGALALAGESTPSWAALECASAYVPSVLSVDCAAKTNFDQFRRNKGKVALVGTVSMLNVRGKFGTYNAANLFLFPALKLGAKSTEITAVFPTSTGNRQASPLPVGHSEEAFLGGILVVPRSSFIGFTVDEPFGEGRERMTALFTNGKLPDTTSIGINWTVSNLNRPWFAGSSAIPHTDACNGSAWRKLIIEGLKQASGSC